MSESMWTISFSTWTKRLAFFSAGGVQTVLHLLLHLLAVIKTRKHIIFYSFGIRWEPDHATHPRHVEADNDCGGERHRQSWLMASSKQAMCNILLLIILHWLIICLLRFNFSVRLGLLLENDITLASRTNSYRSSLLLHTAKWSYLLFSFRPSYHF